MRCEHGFFRILKDPAESTPYDGGYVYIDGGPYDALDELNTEFGGVVSDDVIKELTKELQKLSREWAGISLFYRYLKFFHQYSYELFLRYAELPRP